MPRTTREHNIRDLEAAIAHIDKALLLLQRIDERFPATYEKEKTTIQLIAAPLIQLVELMKNFRHGGL